LSSNSPEAEDIDPSKLPRHVAIIMDGNGRWAQKRLLNRMLGHEKGAEAVRTVTRTCRKIGIPILTLYAFSTENWRRPKNEVSALMQLLKTFLIKEEAEMKINGIRLMAIGQMDRLPADVRTVIQHVISATASNRDLILNLALSYGGRAELTDMVRSIAAKIVSGEIKPESIDEEIITRHLYTRGLPDPDLLIRTSGEVRISNFMLWQLAYTEIFITPTLWPDFSGEEFVTIIREFQKRERRFGGVIES
jgi:undecaprenyl diphosphate synthase